MKPKRGKCHFICSTNKNGSLIVENKEINNSKHVKLLGIKIDSNSQLIFI